QVFAVGDPVGEPADDGPCFVQLPAVGLRSAVDLGEVALHGVDPAVDFFVRAWFRARSLTAGTAARSQAGPHHDVAEDERVVQRGAADHHAVDGRRLEHPDGVGGDLHVAVAPHGDLQRGLHVGDVTPVARAGVGLVARPAVDGDG